MPNLDANWAYAFLAAALLLFLLSTRQFALIARAAIWLVGAALLACAAIAVLGDPAHVGLLRVAQDVAAQRDANVLRVSLLENWRTVSDAIVPMFDIFLLGAAVLALIALIAFTPGETIERIVRPLCWMLLGASFGGFLALAIISLGLGGAPDRRAYAAVFGPENVIDGDTVRIGATSLRLWGIDAVEHDQICLAADGAQQQCGIEATQRLVALTGGHLVVCAPPPDVKPGRPLARALGRPVVSCFVRGEGGQEHDLAQTLAREGLADLYRDDSGRVRSSYQAEVAAASSAPNSIWTLCTLKPEAWRKHDNREAFLHGARNAADLLHPCAEGQS